MTAPDHLEQPDEFAQLDEPPTDPPGPNDRPVLLVSTRRRADGLEVAAASRVPIPSWWSRSPLAIAAEQAAHERTHEVGGWNLDDDGPLAFHVEPSRTTARHGTIVRTGA